ncbi:helix-turn-helix domain-containing protein [Rhizosphaericola mali]|uniref:Helix-turn-helix transcriptional regulator n=1 Tax=Rhizosphaericola mali TaxID=2545455 RepID=A0A5P2G3F9_9BACT|nr:AraC family transcriptional regulator [Rhizosphaericola mali]QES88352.1 helix-turn-helix transcriptional regulator [Rhizosphaericola mali]
MINIESLEEFYKSKLISIPEKLKNGIGHFDVVPFSLDANCAIKPIPYRFRQYLKIGLMFGQYKLHFSDKTYEIRKNALVFTNSEVPYSWVPIGSNQYGFFCLFTESFFHHFGEPKKYSVFQPNGIPVVELSDNDADKIKQIFEEMITEWRSDNIHKYDKMRISVFEMLLAAEKLLPKELKSVYYSNASQKIASQFLELLERQFSDEIEGPILLRSANDFAENISVHVNHLNKALKEVLHKSTSEIIQERILVEAKILLKQTQKDVSEIAFELGFKENTHFHNFFKKQTLMTPTQYRLN